MTKGRISLLVDSPLRDLAIAYRSIPADLRKQINQATKKDAQPIWKTEVTQRGVTRIQQRVLVDTAKVGVTSRNVLLRSGGGKMADLLIAAENGRPAAAPIKSHSKKGKPYTRTTGSLFGDRTRGGKVVHPAAWASIPRLASLWIQTTIRTLHEAGEKVH